MTRRYAPLAMLVTGVSLGVASVSAGRANPGWWFAGDSVTAAALELLAGLALIGAGAAAWRRRPASRFGPLLGAAGFAWFAPEWNNPEIGSSVAFTAGLLLSAACAPLVAHAALAYPGGRLRSPIERVTIAVAYVASIVLVGVLPALLFDPADAGCAECPSNLVVVSADGELAASMERLGLRLGLGWIAVVVLLCVWRLARGGVAKRRLVAPVLLPASLYLAFVAWDFQHSAGRGFLSNDSVELRLWAAEAVALCMLAAGASWETVRARRTRSALAALVVELQRSPAPGGLRAALARRLGDPTLELFHRLGDGRLVDSAGRLHAARPGQALTPLVCGGRELAVVAHRPGLFDDPGLGPEVATAAQLALDNERLQAELRAQLEDLRASRARIVEAGDRERLRLERDLHDGAQQRLVTLSLAIGLAKAQLEAGTDRQLVDSLERAQQQLVELLATLRELAHGLYPVALAEEGFAAAVEALAEDPLAPLRIERPLPEERLEPAVESAAYLVVREMVRGRGPGRTSIRATREHTGLVVEVAADGGPPADTLHLEDRIGAVGGRLQVNRTAGDVTRVRAELPCA